MITMFASEAKKEAKAHVQNLVSLAKADGILHKNEVRLIKKIGLQKGLEEGGIKKLILSDKKVEVKVPESIEARWEQIYHLVELMMSDGEISESEMSFCEDIALRMNFNKSIVGALVAKIERGISQDLPKEEILAECSPFVNY